MAHDFKPVKTPAGQRALDPARDHSMRFPEVVEAVDGFHHTSFRIRNKPFVIMGENAEGPWLSIKADIPTQEWLIKQGGFSPTPYIGQHGWVTPDSLKTADWVQLAELITDAYMRVAPKRLAAQAREKIDA